MNTTLKLAILAALVLAGPLLSQKSAALDAAAQPSDSNELVTIVVTAEKRAESLSNVPMSVTASNAINASVFDAFIMLDGCFRILVC